MVILVVDNNICQKIDDIKTTLNNVVDQKVRDELIMKLNVLNGKWNEYRSFIDNNTFSNSIYKFIKYKNDIYCTTCKSPSVKFDKEFMYQCTFCGSMEVQNSSDVQILDQPEKIPNAHGCDYQEINHLDTIMSELEIHRSSYFVDKKIIALVRRYLKTVIIDFDTISYLDVLTSLHDLRYNTMYKHAIYIYHMITGNDIPKLSSSQRQSLYKMFNSVVLTWKKILPFDKSNLIVYKYILRKLFEILNLEQFFEFFPYSNNEVNIGTLDKYWYNICEDLGPPFEFKNSLQYKAFIKHIYD